MHDIWFKLILPVMSAKSASKSPARDRLYRPGSCDVGVGRQSCQSLFPGMFVELSFLAWSVFGCLEPMEEVCREGKGRLCVCPMHIHSHTYRAHHPCVITGVQSGTVTQLLKSFTHKKIFLKSVPTLTHCTPCNSSQVFCNYWGFDLWQPFINPWP